MHAGAVAHGYNVINAVPVVNIVCVAKKRWGLGRRYQLRDEAL